MAIANPWPETHTLLTLMIPVSRALAVPGDEWDRFCEGSADDLVAMMKRSIRELPKAV